MRNLIALSTETTAFDIRSFEAPDSCFYPTYTWIWNAPVDKAGIRRQLDEMLEAGIRGVYILPEPPTFRPGSMKTTLTPPYLSDAFMELVQTALEYAVSLDMAVWMYDEGGWPSGSACGQVVKMDPSLARKGLASRQVSLPAHQAYMPQEGVLAAFAEDGRRVLDGDVATRARTLTVYEVRMENAYNGFGVDPFEKDLGETFVRSTHERYRAFAGHLFDGRVPAMFTDEPNGSGRPWPRGFAALFQARYGYDATEYLPVILGDRPAEAAMEVQARIDYGLLSGELFRQNYLEPIRAWCRHNNLLSTGHFNSDQTTDGTLVHAFGNVMALLRTLDIPGVDVIWRQVDPNHHGAPSTEGNAFFPRFASSAAAQIGRKFAVSESFGVYGAGLTANEMRYVINFQYVRGINLMNVMNSSYGHTRANAIVERPTFVPQMPGYGHLRLINDYTARASYLLQLGRAKVDTALYYPVRDIWADAEASRRAIHSFDALGLSLERQHVDFDIIDDDAVLQARFENGAMQLGHASYRHVFIPETQHMPDAVRDRLAQLDSEAVPSIRCDSEDIRARVRDLGDGDSLYFLYNEAAAPRTITLSLEADRPAYALSLTDGRILQADLSQPLMFFSGEAKAFLLTNKPVPAEPPRAVQRQWTLDGFMAAKVRAYHLDAEGVRSEAYPADFRPVPLGEWTEAFGADFSGEALYRAEVDLDGPIQPEDAFALDLGRVECSASVRIDGREVGIVSMDPMRLHIAAGIIPASGRFVLEVLVANTCANQLCAVPVEALFPPEEYGPYHPRTIVFERNAPKGGLYGPVTLSLLS